MKKLLLWTSTLGLLALGGALLLAHRGAPPAALDEDAPLFSSLVQGSGQLIQLQAREPLRAVRWLAPLPGGWGLCQVGTQSDRQLVGLFKDGALAHTFQLPRAKGMTDGFYRQAEIREAAMANGTLLLLVKADGGHRELPVVMALTQAGELRGAQRVQGEHLALSNEALWTWGPTGAQRHPLPLDGPSTPAPETVPWPYEVSAPTALLPTPAGFLVSHAKGLSAWRGEAGWTHTPNPTTSAWAFPAPTGALTQGASEIYWQPEPGRLLKVTPEARVLAPEPLPSPDPAGMDATLLKLLGCDREGRLWFGLTSPSLPLATPVTPAPQAPSEGAAPAPTPVGAPTAPHSFTAESIAALESHLKAPLDRIYVWKPGDKAMRLITWSQVWPRLGAPASVPAPSGDADLKPEAKGLWLGSGQAHWWLPFQALP
jgi:hypothetical protein